MFNLKSLKIIVLVCCFIGLESMISKKIFQHHNVNSFSSSSTRRTTFQNHVWNGHCKNSNNNHLYINDEITFRTRVGDSIPSFIPKAERYSTRDWWENLKTMRTSKLMRRLREVISFHTIWSLAICFLHKLISFDLPSSKAHALLGGALSLLLVFRTNSAYDRFWEGRKIWGSLLSSLRDFGRMAVVYSDMVPEDRLERMLHLLIAFPVVLQEYVQGFRQPEQLRGLMSDEEIRDLDTVTNRPFFIINRLAKEVRRIPESEYFTTRERERMFKLIDEISRSISSCERIVQTPIPLEYARHTSRFLTLWCLTLPLCLVAEIGYHVVPFTTLITWALYGIQDLGMRIEDPFQRTLKLEIFANTIKRDLSELLHVSDASLYPLTIKSVKLKYERPFYSTSIEANIADPFPRPMSFNNTTSNIFAFKY